MDRLLFLGGVVVLFAAFSECVSLAGTWVGLKNAFACLRARVVCSVSMTSGINMHRVSEE